MGARSSARTVCRPRNADLLKAIAAAVPLIVATTTTRSPTFRLASNALVHPGSWKKLAYHWVDQPVGGKVKVGLSVKLRGITIRDGATSHRATRPQKIHSAP